MPYFYIVQPVPEHLPWQVKLGYTIDVQQRLRNYQGFCPQARLVKSWDCVDYAAEARAMKAVIGLGLERLAKEVFVCHDLEYLITFLDAFFPPVPHAKPKKVSPAPQPTQTCEWFAPEEAAQQIGIDVEQLLHWIQVDKVAHFKIAATIRIHQDEVQRLSRLKWVQAAIG